SWAGGGGSAAHLTATRTPASSNPARRREASGSSSAAYSVTGPAGSRPPAHDAMAASTKRSSRRSRSVRASTSSCSRRFSARMRFRPSSMRSTSRICSSRSMPSWLSWVPMSMPTPRARNTPTMPARWQRKSITAFPPARLQSRQKAQMQPRQLQPLFQRAAQGYQYARRHQGRQRDLHGLRRPRAGAVQPADAPGVHQSGADFQAHEKGGTHARTAFFQKIDQIGMGTDGDNQV